MAMQYDTGEVQIVVLGGTNKKSGQKNPTELKGYFLRSSTIKTKFGEKPLYVFQTEEGEQGLIGSGNLNKLMQSKRVGLMTHIIDTGTVKDVGKGNPMKVFKVGQDASDVLDETLGASSESVNYDEPLSDDEDEFEAPVVAARPIAPKAPAATPSSDVQARTRALLSGRR